MARPIARKAGREGDCVLSARDVVIAAAWYADYVNKVTEHVESARLSGLDGRSGWIKHGMGLLWMLMIPGVWHGEPVGELIVIWGG